jgi:hypothetical protein
MEDGATIAQVLKLAGKSDVPLALRSYQDIRYDRVRETQLLGEQYVSLCTSSLRSRASRRTKLMFPLLAGYETPGTSLATGTTSTPSQSSFLTLPLSLGTTLPPTPSPSSLLRLRGYEPSLARRRSRRWSRPRMLRWMLEERRRRLLLLLRGLEWQLVLERCQVCLFLSLELDARRESASSFRPLCEVASLRSSFGLTI